MNQTTLRESFKKARNYEELLTQYDLPPLQTRFSLKLRISRANRRDSKKHMDLIDILRANLIKMLEKMRKYVCDKKEDLAIMPWSDNSDKEVIYFASQFPQSLVSLQEYFPNCYAPKDGKELYTKVRFAHTIHAEKLRLGCADWFYNNGGGLYSQSLQVENITGCGWLMYSHPQFDTVELAKEIEEAIGTPTGLKWKVIPLGRKGFSKDAPRALGVEVDERDYNKAKRLLNNWLRSRTVRFYPLNIKVRWIPEWKEINDPDAKKEIKKLAGRQKYFTRELLSETVDIFNDIKSLVYIEGQTFTIRELAMRLEAKDFPGCSIFHAMFEDERTGDTKVFFYPSVEDEARTKLKNLHLILRTKYGAEVDGAFTWEAIEESNDKTYDVNTGVVTSALDVGITEGLDNNPMFNFDNMEQVLDSEQSASTNKRGLYAEDRSIATVGIVRGNQEETEIINDEEVQMKDAEKERKASKKSAKKASKRDKKEKKKKKKKKASSMRDGGSLDS